MTAALTRLPAGELLHDLLHDLIREHQLPGAQLVLRHAGDTAAVCAGVTEHGDSRPVTEDTAFPIGSITKSFTATMAMILLADGDLELDAPIGLHLPGLGELGSTVTLRHLLSHTAGLSCGPASDEVRDLSLRRYVEEQCHAENLVLRPGAGFSYSNLGYAAAGLLIEEITGMSWAEAIESIVLRPLGITAAFVDAPGSRELASGHSVNLLTGRIRPVSQSLAPGEAPAGALAMSAADLAALGSLHVGGGRPAVLPRYYTDLMRRPLADAEPFGLADGWGLGLATFHAGERRWVGHDGNADGTACYLRMEPDADWIVAFTCNGSTGLDAWRRLIGELTAAGVPLTATGGCTATPRLATAERCVGVYANGDLEYEVTADDDGALWLSVDGDPAEQVALREDLTFLLRDDATGRWSLGGRFVPDAERAAVEGIQLGGRLATRRALVHQ